MKKRTSKKTAQDALSQAEVVSHAGEEESSSRESTRLAVNPAKSPSTFRHNTASIHSASTLSATQHKVYWALMAHAQKTEQSRYLDGDGERKLPHAQTYRISTKDLLTQAGVGATRNLTWLKGNILPLLDKKIVYDLFDSTNTKVGFGGFNVVSQIEVKDGWVEFSFPPALQKEVINPTQYAYHALEVTNRILSGKFAPLLYLNTVRFRNTRTTGWRPIEKWRAVLGADDPTYDVTKAFLSKVIRPAVEQINELTDITVEPEYEKQQQRIVAIRFSVIEKSVALTKLADAREQTSNRDHSRQNVHHTLEAELRELGLTQKAAKFHIDSDPDRAHRLARYTRETAQKQAIRNPAGLFVKLFKEGFDPRQIGLPLVASSGMHTAHPESTVILPSEPSNAYRVAFEWIKLATPEALAIALDDFRAVQRDATSQFDAAKRTFKSKRIQLEFVVWLMKRGT